MHVAYPSRTLNPRLYYPVPLTLIPVPQACLQYVLGLANVRWDPNYVVAAGVSNGGAIVAPLASRYSIYTHAMIFHAR